MELQNLDPDDTTIVRLSLSETGPCVAAARTQSVKFIQHCITRMRAVEIF